MLRIYVPVSHGEKESYGDLLTVIPQYIEDLHKLYFVWNMKFSSTIKYTMNTLHVWTPV